METSKETLLQDWLGQAWRRSRRRGLSASDGGWLLFALALAFFAPNFLRGSLWWCPERAAAMGILLALPVGLLPPILAMEARARKTILLALEALGMRKPSGRRQDPCKGTPGPQLAARAQALSPP